MSSFLPYLFLFLLIFLPSSNMQQFNGLPFSNGAEFGALMLLIPFLFSDPLRRTAAAILQKVRLSTPVFYILLGFIFLLKVSLWIFGGQEGFTGCYSSPAVWATGGMEGGPNGACERSYEDLFHRSGATRMDWAISFDPGTWNLTFLNSLRYDFPDSVAGSIPRSRIPIDVYWNGKVEPQNAFRMIIRYTGEGILTVGSVETILPSSYSGINEVAVEIPAGKQDFVLQYSFNDHSANGQDEAAWGPPAQIHVLEIGNAGEQTLHAMPPALPWRILAAISDLILVVLLSLLLWSFMAGLGKDKWLVLAAFCFMAVSYFLPFSQRIRELVMVAGLIGFWLWHLLRKQTRPLAFYLVLVCVGAAIALLWFPTPTQVVLRNAWDDPLTYESQAYTILSSSSLEGGESVFFYQPMYRYIKFGEHALFGDGMTFTCAAQLAFFLGGVYFLLETTLRKVAAFRRRMLLGVIGSIMFFLGGFYVSIVIRAGLSEYMTWSLLLWTLPLLFLKEVSAGYVSGLAALAFSFTVRTNQLFAIAWIILCASYVWWQKNRKIILFGMVIAGLIFLLPLAHNWYFGHAVMIATASGENSINLPLPPSTWLAFFGGDAAAAAAVRGQLAMMFLLVDGSLSAWLVFGPMAIVFIIWILIFGYSVIRRRTSDWPLLSIPLWYLAPHLFFILNIYYPRLIFIAYLSMAAVVIVWLARERAVGADRNVMRS